MFQGSLTWPGWALFCTQPIWGSNPSPVTCGRVILGTLHSFPKIQFPCHNDVYFMVLLGS